MSPSFVFLKLVVYVQPKTSQTSKTRTADTMACLTTTWIIIRKTTAKTTTMKKTTMTMTTTETTAAGIVLSISINAAWQGPPLMVFARCSVAVITPMIGRTMTNTRITTAITAARRMTKTKTPSMECTKMITLGLPQLAIEVVAVVVRATCAFALAIQTATSILI